MLRIGTVTAGMAAFSLGTFTANKPMKKSGAVEPKRGTSSPPATAKAKMPAMECSTGL